MAIKFSKTDDLDKMFENFASFSRSRKKQLNSPKKKKKAETAAKDAKEG